MSKRGFTSNMAEALMTTSGEIEAYPLSLFLSSGVRSSPSMLRRDDGDHNPLHHQPHHRQAKGVTPLSVGSGSAADDDLLTQPLMGINLGESGEMPGVLPSHAPPSPAAVASKGREFRGNRKQEGEEEEEEETGDLRRYLKRGRMMEVEATGGDAASLGEQHTTPILVQPLKTAHPMLPHYIPPSTTSSSGQVLTGSSSARRSLSVTSSHHRHHHHSSLPFILLTPEGELNGDHTPREEDDDSLETPHSNNNTALHMLDIHSLQQQTYASAYSYPPQPAGQHNAPIRSTFAQQSAFSTSNNSSCPPFLMPGGSPSSLPSSVAQWNPWTDQSTTKISVPMCKPVHSAICNTDEDAYELAKTTPDALSTEDKDGSGRKTGRRISRSGCSSLTTSGAYMSPRAFPSLASLSTSAPCIPTMASFTPRSYSSEACVASSPRFSLPAGQIPGGTFAHSQTTQPTFDFPETKGRYHVHKKIGEGTFSTVYKATPLSNPSQPVALKRLYPTSSPSRVRNEIRHLKLLGGTNFVLPLLGGLREGDQITLVLPYFKHDRFKEYINRFTVDQLRHYLFALFTSLHHMHRHAVIHRDVKPSNFLYSIERNEYLLVDFGLAELDESKVLQAENSSDIALQNYVRSFLGISSGERGSIARAFLQARGQTRRAGRAGTRGFRAPEVLMRSTYQTTALDVWSAGVVLLCILTTRYPFFHSPDDMTALAEVACITGTSELQQTAAILDKRVLFPEARAKMDWRALCLSLTSNKSVYDFPPEVFDLLDRCLTPNPCLRITAAEALQHPFLRGVNPASYPQMQAQHPARQPPFQ